MEIGLVGLPNAGKSTLFNALTKKGVPAASYPFTTIEPNIGVVTVPDARLDKLAETLQPKTVVPTVVKFVDIAGLVKGASKGEGLGNQFLAHIREVDAIAQIVRCFGGDDSREENGAGPADDIETINTELALADLDTAEKRQEKLRKLMKTGDKAVAELKKEIDELVELLSQGHPARTFPSIDKFADLHLLTAKPMILVANIDEDDLRLKKFESTEEVKRYAEKHEDDFLIVSAKVESELAELEADEATMFRQELDLERSGLDELIKASYHTLGLMSFFTASSKECRAWTVNRGATAVEAAGTIHTDFARGFIKAEVINWELLCEDESENVARDRGHLRLEGRDYLVLDGDVIHFRFNT